MKKLSIMGLVIALMLVVVPNVKADVQTYVDEIYNVGKEYGMTSENKVELERFVRDYNITEEQASKLAEYANQVAKVFSDAGKTSYSELTTDQKAQLKDYANQAATAVDVKLVFKTKSVEVYKDNTLVITLQNTNDKLVSTGSNPYLMVSISLVGIFALVAGLSSKKKAELN